MTTSQAPVLVIATRNPGKVREFRQLLDGLPFRILSLDDVGVGIEVEETGDTFAANAELKASQYYAASGELTLADDSGIEGDALKGAPGIYSARFAGEGARDQANLEKLLNALTSIPEQQRSARFQCVMVLLQHIDHHRRSLDI